MWSLVAQSDNFASPWEQLNGHLLRLVTGRIIFLYIGDWTTHDTLNEILNILNVVIQAHLEDHMKTF